ncbi:MAG: helix-turn-helix transcriptional regulator [Dysosmobacter welbionis]
MQQSHGERIRSIRKQEGMTQERLAELLETDSKTLSRIENGDRF